jgi:hypothetical protein
MLTLTNACLHQSHALTIMCPYYHLHPCLSIASHASCILVNLRTQPQILHSPFYLISELTLRVITYVTLSQCYCDRCTASWILSKQRQWDCFFLYNTMIGANNK